MAKKKPAKPATKGKAKAKAKAKPKGKAPNPHKQKFTPEKVIEAIRKTHGVIWDAAKRLRCSPHTIHNYKKIYPEVAQAIEEAREEIIDLAEGTLVLLLKRNDFRAMRFALLTIGKNRGYVIRSEHDHRGKDGGPIQLEHTKRVEELSDDQLAAIVEQLEPGAIGAGDPARSSGGTAPAPASQAID